MTQSEHIVEVTQETFASTVLEGSKQRLVMVDFWAIWCQPCQMLMPILSKLVQAYAGKILLAKVNTDEQQALATHYGVRSLPTVMLFRNGQAVDQFMGVQPESAIRGLLDKYLPRASDNNRNAALTALEAGDTEGALKMLHSALAADPDNQAIKIDLAEVFMLLGRFDEADQAIKTLPIDLHQQDQVRQLEARLALARVAPTDKDVQNLQHNLRQHPDDAQTLHQLGAHYALHGEPAKALELFLCLMQKHRKYNDDAGYKGLLATFEILGARHPLVNEYRRKMVSLLY